MSNISRQRYHNAPPATKKSLFRNPLLWIFFVSVTVITFVILIRNDNNVRVMTGGYILRAERELKRELPLVKRLLNIQVTGSDGDALRRAVESNNIEAIKILAHSDANLNEGGESETSAVHLASEKDLRPALGALIESGVDINQRDRIGRTPLMSAAEGDAAGALQYLLGLGANVNLQDNSGRTAVMYATARGNYSAVQLLLATGANANLLTNDGKSALHYAIDRGNPQLVKLLLDSGANVTALDRDGHSPLRYAMGKGNQAVVAVLKQAGATLEDSPQVVAAEDSTVTEAAEETAPSEPSEPPLEEEVTPEVSPEPTAPRKTRLRVVGKPIGTWERYKTITLTAVETSVRNAGTVTAEGVQVSVEVPNGETILLNGPDTLPPNKTAKYTVDTSQTIFRPGELRAKASCDNCLR